MSIFNFGSINLDFVYRVERFVRPGETVQTRDFQRFAGGKGLNQSIALARAGVPPRHVGRIGEDGHWLLEFLQNEGVDTRAIELGSTPTGHAIIQVDDAGENSILVHAGANGEISHPHLDEICSGLTAQDWVLLQNETNGLARVMEQASQKNAAVILNPSPVEKNILELPLQHVTMFLINRSEGQALSGEDEPECMVDALLDRFPKAAVILTLGSEGVLYGRREQQLKVPAEPVEAVDTTGAGDTFAGFFLADLYTGGSPERALRVACRAAGQCVTRAGAAASIPMKSQLAP